MKTLSRLLLMLTVCAFPLQASEGNREQTVHFTPGTEEATVKGHLAGRESIDYVFSAKRHQPLTVALHTDHP